MANKRQKKKQQKQFVIKAAKKKGLSSREIKQLDQAQIKKIAKAEQARIRRRERENGRYKRMIKSGVPAKDAQKMRGWADARIDEFIKKLQKKNKPKPKKEQLLLFWNDLVEITDTELPGIIRGYTRGLSEARLVDEIKAILYKNSGEIGTYQLWVTDDTKGMEWFFQDQALVYRGQGKGYRTLLEVIRVMMDLIYDSMEKYQFINEFIQSIAYFSSKNAEKLNAALL